MVSIPHLLCMLPVIVQAQITINIKALEPSKASVEATGLLETMLTEDHKEIFHITDRLLKNAIFNLTGQSGDVYLQEPSFGGSIYENYKLEPVKTVLKPNRTIVNVKTEEVFLNNIQAFNNDDFEKTQNIALTGHVEDNITCVWKQNDVFPAAITYNIDVIGLGKDPSWNIKSNFGRKIEKTQNVPISASFAVKLGAKRDVTAVISAIKVTLLIDIFYTVTLTGHVLTKFENTYLWGYENHDIETVMATASMPHIVMLSEEITVEFYTNCIVKVFGNDLSPTSTKYGDNQCAFTTVDGGKNVTLGSLSRPKHEILREMKSQGNNDVINSDVSFLVFFTCIFLKILMFN